MAVNSIGKKMQKNSETNSEDLTTFPAGETVENSAAAATPAATPAATADTSNAANSTDSKIPYAADKSNAKSERRSAPLDPQSSATSELAALLSVEQDINAADIKEKEIRKAINRIDNPSEREVQIIEQMANSIVNQWLHTPMTNMKRLAGKRIDQIDCYIRAINDLWDLKQ